ncbi:MAG: DUF448 domain-containing protein [Proteobacteria bacterium]|nr:DUF448 domain-containing protein [Pseudomonadota bacterium]
MKVGKKDSSSSRQDKRMRICVSCRNRKPIKELLRIIRTPEGDLAIDWRRNLGGRGAHVCPAKSCIEDAVKNRSFNHALKTKINYSRAQYLIKSAQDFFLKRISTLISSCSGLGAIAPGADAATSALKQNKAFLILVANDSSLKADYENKAKKNSIPLRILKNKELIGELTGRRPTGVLAICNAGLANALMAAIDKSKEL